MVNKQDQRFFKIGWSVKNKFLPLGALVALLAWPGLALGQISEPPPVESFALGEAGAEEAAKPQDQPKSSTAKGNPATSADKKPSAGNKSDEYTDLDDFFIGMVEDTESGKPSPSTSGTPPLPPGTTGFTPLPQKQESASTTSSSSAPADPAERRSVPSASPNPDFEPAQLGSEEGQISSAPFEPPSADSNQETGTQSVTLPLGQGGALPQPDWKDVSNTESPKAQAVSEPVAPQFDSGGSKWKQLEIGQSDRTGKLPTAPPAPPSSVPTVNVSPSERLDAMMDDAPEKTDQAPSPASDQAPPASSTTPAGLERARQLFGDMMADDTQRAKGNPSLGGGLTPPPAVESASPTAVSTPANSNQTNAVDDYDGASSILKAGGLLTLDNHYGKAGVLPPLSGQPEKSDKPADLAAPASSSPAASQPAKKESTPKKESSRQASGSKRTKAPAKPAAKAAAPVTSVSLIIINETDNPKIGDIYKSVLSKVGHRVVSVGQGHPSGSPEQTVIKYRPGSLAKAQAVARSLPGRKVLSEAKGGEVLAAEVMVFIR